MKIGNLRTDLKAEIEGVWVPIGDGGEVRVARANNLHYLAKYRELTKPFWSEIRSGQLTVEKNLEIITQCVAQTVLIDWRGITDVVKDADGKLVLDADGKPVEEPVPYTVAKAVEFLSTISDFRELVQTISEQQFRYRQQEIALAVGNS